MNMIGGKSNCGEGGEDPARFRTRGTARDRNSRIKQIASGRFGVTPEYCAFADELNIKMAQGSKPGEGGQLPGHKVSAGDRAAAAHPARRRAHLAAAAPRHLLDRGPRAAHLRPEAGQPARRRVGEAGGRGRRRHDRRRRREGARRRRADLGCERRHRRVAAVVDQERRACRGSSGSPTRQATLIEEGLRDRVRVRVDGGFKTGRDVLIAALLGADEYSFGTAAMLAEGCIMVRACHRDTCPTGIATQRPNLRAKFAGIARGRRHLHALHRPGGARAARVARPALARRGDRPGRVPPPADDRRRARRRARPVTARSSVPDDPTAPRRFVAHVAIQRPRSELDARLLDDAYAAIWEGRDVELAYEITNADRTVGASLGGAIGLEWGEQLPPGSVTRALQRLGRAELRRVPRRRHHPRARRRGPGLRRQGPGRRPHRRPPAGRRRRRPGAGGQHRPLRRDRAGSCYVAGPGGGAVLRAQQRRDRRRRGHAATTRAST